MTTDEMINIMRREPDLVPIVLSELTPLHRLVFLRVNGIFINQQSQKAIADELGVSRQYVQKIVKKTRNWLKHPSRVRLIQEHIASKAADEFNNNQKILKNIEG